MEGPDLQIKVKKTANITMIIFGSKESIFVWHKKWLG